MRVSSSITLASLPPERRHLLKLMQQINFGRIENLTVRNGQPVLSPPPRIVHEMKFGAETGPRPELGTADFLLKRQAVELFEFFDERPNGVIAVLDIKRGLPFRAIVIEVPS
jgi:hypothetical protein